MDGIVSHKKHSLTGKSVGQPVSNENIVGVSGHCGMNVVGSKIPSSLIFNNFQRKNI